MNHPFPSSSCGRTLQPPLPRISNHGYLQMHCTLTRLPKTHAFSRSPTLFPCAKTSFWEQNWETPDALRLSAAQCLLPRLRKLEALIPTKNRIPPTPQQHDAGLHALSSESQKVCPLCPQCIFPWWLVAFLFCWFNKWMPVLGEAMNYITGYPDGGIWHGSRNK